MVLRVLPLRIAVGQRDMLWTLSGLKYLFGKVVHRIPYGEPTDNQNGNENKEYVCEIDAHGVGIDDETAFAVAHCYQSVLLLCPAEDGSEQEAEQGSCKADDVPFEAEDGAYLSIVCSKAAECPYVLPFVYHEHGERADDIEACHQQDKGEEDVGDEFFDAHDAENVVLLFVSVLHLEAFAEQCLQLLFCLVCLEAFFDFDFHARHSALSLEEALGEAETGEDVVCIVLCLSHDEDDAGALQLLVIEGGERVAHVDALAGFGGIDLEGVLEVGRESELLGKLYAEYAVFQDIGMQAEGAVAVEDFLDMGLFGDVVCHAFYGDHLLPSVLHDECLPFEHGCIDVHCLVFLELEQSGVFGADGLSVGECDAQFGVEGCEEVGHEVLESVEDAEGDNHRHGGDGYAKHRYAADDVDGVVALLGKEVASGYEEFVVHFLSSSSICST